MLDFKVFGEKETKNLVEELKTKNSEKLELRLIIDFFGEETAICIYQILECFQFYKIKLTIRHLVTNHIAEESLKFFCSLSAALEKQLNLHEFWFDFPLNSSIDLERKLIFQILSGLFHNANLKILSLHKMTYTQNTFSIFKDFIEKCASLVRLDLEDNQIEDQAAAIIINAAYYNSNLLSINLSNNNITSAIIPIKMAAPAVCDISINNNYYVPASMQRYSLRNRSNRNFLTSRGKIFYLLNFRYRPEYLMDQFGRSIMDDMRRLIFSLKMTYYKNHSSLNIDFSLNPTHRLNLLRLLKREAKCWEKSSDENALSTELLLKDIIICASSAILPKFIFSFSAYPGIFYWEGDPNHLPDRVTPNFKPAQAHEVQKLLEKARPQDVNRYLVIDEFVWSQIVKYFIQSKLNIETDLFFIYHHSRADFYHYSFILTDQLFKKIMPGMPSTLTTLCLNDCHSLTLPTILEELRAFPNIRNLCLMNTRAWRNELIGLVKTYPYLESLQISIDTQEPLKILTQFRYLKDLTLDLSNNFGISDLNFLIHLNKFLRRLKVNGCVNLKNFKGIQYCDQLEELSLENMEISNLDELIQLLSSLKNLKLLVLHDSRFSINDEQVEKIKKTLPKVFISVHGVNGRISLGKHMTKQWLTPIDDDKISDSSALMSASPQSCSGELCCDDQYQDSKELYCDDEYQDPEDTYLTTPQIFWDNKGHFPPQNYNRYHSLNIIQVKHNGHIAFVSSGIDKLDLKPYPSPRVLPIEQMDTPLLQEQDYETKNYEVSYIGQVRLTISAFQWTSVPTRGVFCELKACSENLIWARSAVTGAFYVRLPQTNLPNQSILLRYVIITDSLTTQRQVWINELPEVILSSFEALKKNFSILSHFPRFQSFIEAMEKTETQKPAFKLIKEYCQTSESGFTDAPTDEKSSQLVRKFIKTLKIKNRNTADDLFFLFNRLLQQRGACNEASYCAKFLCDYYQLRCHIVTSSNHTFVEFSCQYSNALVTYSYCLGGGDAKVSILPPETIKPAVSREEKPAFDQKIKKNHPHELNKEQIIRQTLSEFKPAIPYGQDCPDLKSYWQLILTTFRPLIYLNQPDDAQKFLAYLRENATQHGFTKQHLFYINSPQQLSDWWQAVQIKNNDLKIVPGWLQDFLLGTPDKKPRLLILDFSKGFDRYDLASHQGVGDVNRTLQGLSLPPEVQVVCFATKQCDDDIFSSRFNIISDRDDLLAESKPLPYLHHLPADRKPETLSVIHFYHDALHASDCLGTPCLEDKKLEFSEGPLSQALEEEKDVCVTEIPQNMAATIFMMVYSGQYMKNGERKSVPNIKFYQGSRAKPASKYIEFVTELKDSSSQFILNPHTYPLLVSGDRYIDEKSGLSHSLPPLLNLEKLAEVIVLTHSMSYSDWSLLIDKINQRGKKIKFYLCSGVEIAGTGHKAPAQPKISQEFKTLDNNCIIESTAPEDTLAFLLAQEKIELDDVLTLTPKIELELLMVLNRTGDDYQLNYRAGWLLNKLLAKKIVVLIGEMQPSLYYVLETLFSPLSYLHTNQGIQTFLKQLVWIIPSRSQIRVSSIVNHYHHVPKPKAVNEKKASPKPLSYRENLDKVIHFITDETPGAIFFELIGPPITITSVSKAIASIRKKTGKIIQHFSAVEDYVTWRKQHPEDKETQCLLQLNNCRMSPTGQLEFLSDIARKNQLYWDGEWYPGLKVIMTHRPETDFRNEKHPFFMNYRVPSLTFAPLERSEIYDDILLPFLNEIKAEAELADIILDVYDYIAKKLLPAVISSEEITYICQRVKTSLSTPGESLAFLCAQACYEEFFGLFSEETERHDFWNLLLKAFKLTGNPRPMVAPPKLLKTLEEKKLFITEPGEQAACMILRLLQVRELDKDYSGKRGLLLEGPPGILKTELSLAVLEEYGFTSAPTVPDGKKNHYLNLVAGDPDLMEKNIRLAHQEDWIVVCNELNLLKKSTLELILKLLAEGLYLIGTQNHYLAGSDRQVLLPDLRDCLQIIYLRNYTFQELSLFALKSGILIGESDLVAKMFLNLVDYQIQYNLSIANPRHYFRWLKELVKLKPEERPLSMMAQSLFKVTAEMSTRKGATPGQYDALEFMLKRIPAEYFPKPRLSETSQLTLFPSPASHFSPTKTDSEGIKTFTAF